MATKKGLSSEDLRNASAQKSCCSIFKLAQKFAEILKNYGKALACSLAASNIPVKIKLTRNLRLLVAAYRLQRSAKRVLSAIERYDRTFFKALERYKEAREYYFRLVALCEGSGNSDPSSKQIIQILGYPLEISLYKLVEDCRESSSLEPGSEQEGSYLRCLKEEYQASLETVSALKKAKNSANPRVCLDALRACLTLDVINGARDLARQLMTANLPLEEKRKFIKEVFPKIKRMVDAEINNAGLSYRRTWGGLLWLAKIEAKNELHLNSKKQEGQGRNFLNEVNVVYEALLTATLGEAAKKAREGEVPETPPRAGSTEQVATIFYRNKNGRCSRNHQTSSTREPYN
jgi:hypothetical protein